MRKNIVTLSENLFFFMGGTEWWDYFNIGAWNHHCDVYIRPMGTTTYLLWHIYMSRGIQRVNYSFKNIWKQPPEVFCKKGVLKNFTNFTGKHSCWSIFLNKVSGLQPASFLKKDSSAFQHKYFPVKLKNIFKRLLLEVSMKKLLLKTL